MVKIMDILGDLVHCSNALKKKAASSIDMLAIFIILS
jgi:hypothetical protein